MKLVKVRCRYDQCKCVMFQVVLASSWLGPQRPLGGPPRTDSGEVQLQAVHLSGEKTLQPAKKPQSNSVKLGEEQASQKPIVFSRGREDKVYVLEGRGVGVYHTQAPHLLDPHPLWDLPALLQGHTGLWTLRYKL